MLRLPIEDALPRLRSVLGQGRDAVLTAPPGSGKTTRVPPALLREPWLEGKRLLMLEPRRLAARAAARYMAAQLGEHVGETVGYRMRLDSKIGPRTRIEVVTEGVLTRLLQTDPSLSDYGIVLFDEFHERSLHADLGLALCLESRRLFRPDLRIIVMSATLDVAPIASLLGKADVVQAEGRTFPVDTRYLTRARTEPLDRAVIAAIRQVLADEPGSLLVFLPGMAEIRRVERGLREASLTGKVVIAPLHGELPQEEQERAIVPPPAGMRKIVLATSIAETSLTIEGVRVVIDSGLLRIPRFDPRTGLTRLATVRVTKDSADQRRGRAGRMEPGVCVRLWSEADHLALAARRPPEILEADLAPLVLDLARWGALVPSELSWLTPPPSGAITQAVEVLTQLGALDENRRLTQHGTQMAEFGLHPRLAHMLLKARALGLGGLACDLAALLTERDLLRLSGDRPHADLRSRLDVLHGDGSDRAGSAVDRGAWRRVRETARLWRRHLQVRPDPDDGGFERAGLLLAFAYPDRIAQRQSVEERRYQLANGSGAAFAKPDALAGDEYLVIAELDAGARWATIALAAPITPAELEAHCAELIRRGDLITWDDRTQSVLATRRRTLGALVLSERSLDRPDPAQLSAALLFGIRGTGLSCLPWSKATRQWRARVAFVRRHGGSASDWPDVTDDGLFSTLEHWLGPSLEGMRSLADLQRIDLAALLEPLLSWQQRRDLDRLAPTHLTVPSGSRLPVEYDAPWPVLAVRLQEMFGCRDTPRVLDHQVPVMLHLLSPAGRPVQITNDLASFWASAYQEVRKELRGRYPKHHWPDDPLSALPTNRAKRRS